MDRLSVTSPRGVGPSASRRSVLLASIAVPSAVVAGGAAAGLADGRILLLAGAILLGWSQLVGP